MMENNNSKSNQTPLPSGGDRGWVPADRLSLVQEYYFSRKLKEVAQLNAEGKDIISLAIGSPDMPPSPDHRETVRGGPPA